MGIRHPKCWNLASEEFEEHVGLTGRLVRFEKVESEGIGMPLTRQRKPPSDEGREKELTNDYLKMANQPRFRRLLPAPP